MALRITEYGGFFSGRPMAPGIPSMPIIQAQSVTVGSSVSTNTLSSGTRLITIDTDAGAFVFIGSSASTGVAASTTSQRVPANLAPIPFYVQPYARVCTLST